MGFISTKCSNCGAKIEIDETIEKGICPYCGVEYVMEKTVNNTVNNMKIENAVFTVENKKITYKTITIGRTSRFWGRDAIFEIWLDGQPYASIANGEIKTIDVDNSTVHTLQCVSTTANAKSNIVQIPAGDKDANIIVNFLQDVLSTKIILTETSETLSKETLSVNKKKLSLSAILGSISFVLIIVILCIVFWTT